MFCICLFVFISLKDAGSLLCLYLIRSMENSDWLESMCISCACVHLCNFISCEDCKVNLHGHTILMDERREGISLEEEFSSPVGVSPAPRSDPRRTPATPPPRDSGRPRGLSHAVDALMNGGSHDGALLPDGGGAGDVRLRLASSPTAEGPSRPPFHSSL